MRDYSVKYQWESFAEKTNINSLDKDSVQYREVRRCFYAGALAMYSSTLDASAQLSNKQTERLLLALKEEFNEFLRNELVTEAFRQHRN